MSYRFMCRAVVVIAMTTGFALSAATCLRAAQRPNIVIILLDDLGYSDLGCYGGDVHTPTIDRLAAEGLRFTSFYNCARCCPTRAALLSGLYPHQVGLQHNGASMTRDGATIAELLGGAGYQTAMAGKWHLTAATPLKPQLRHMKWLNHQAKLDRDFGSIDTYPARRGFDRYYGIIWGVADYFDPFSLVDGVKPVQTVPEDYYITDAITDHAAEYIAGADHDKPLFLYLAYTAPHWPLHARPQDIASYRGKFSDGWHAMRDRRYQRQVAMGLIDPATHPLPAVMGSGKDWDQLSDDEQAAQAAKMQVHAAMVDRVDQNVARIIESLKQTGRYDNTVIFVLSDNGASPEIPGGPGYDRSGQTRDGRPIRRQVPADEIGRQTSYTGIGPYWANAVNTPYRYWKIESFEGGAHTPLIVHWPAGLTAKAGSVTDQTGHVIDLMPTCLDLAGVKYPRELAGRALLPVEGLSLAPILRNQKRNGHDALYFEHERGKAIIAGGYKAVQPTRGDTWELYHLQTDRTETRNLAADQPHRLEQLVDQWARWAQRVGAQRLQ